MTKKELGQYFTTNEQLQEFIFKNIRNLGDKLLEPSVGAGHLLKKLKQYNPNYPIVCYEIDPTITPIVNQKVIYQDFLESDIHDTFKTIIGNPPFVKKKGGNMYIRFIDKCLDLLDDSGELLFIVPSDFLHITSARSTIKRMMKEGTITDVLLPNNENLFENASVDVVAFRYEKGAKNEKCIVNDVEKYIKCVGGIVTFTDTCDANTILSSLFNIYVGCVSGMESVFKHHLGDTQFIVGENLTSQYIFPTIFPTGNPDVDTYLESNKDKLMTRKIRKMTDDNWWMWGALRNCNFVKNNLNKPCIYVKTLTRDERVAWIGTVQWFGGSLLCLFPHNQDVNLEKVVEIINSKEFREQRVRAGRFKMAQSQLLNASISY